MKIIIPFLILLFLFSTCLFSQERGLKKVVRTPQGKEITLYKGSYALVVGNGKYTAGWDELPGAVKDAEEIADVLRRKGFRVTLVKNVDKRTFLSEFSNFTYRYGQDEDNQLLFYYAGHGHTIPLATGEELGYLVMIDTPLLEKDLQGFDIKSVDMQAIITYAKKIKSKHVLFMFDCCFSGTILNLREKVTPKAISDAVQYPVRQFITAGRVNEPVPDRSIFKQIFLDLLEGRRDEPIKDGYLTGEELGLYLKNTVPEYYNFQHPQYGKIRDPNLDMGDFVFVLEKAGLGVQEEIPTPPKAEKLDLSSIEESAKRREEARRKWSNWLEQMESDFKKVKSIDQNPENTAEEKKSAWGEFLRNYNADNPFSTEDEQLRQRATQRLNFWESYKPPDSQEALKEKSRDVRTNQNLAQAYEKSGQHEKAEEVYKFLAQIEPENVVRYYRAILMMYDKAKMTDKAIEIARKISEMDSNNYESFYNLGFMYQNAKRYNEAIEAFKKAIELNPGYEYSYSSIGYIYYQQKRYSQSIEYFKKLVGILPDHSDGWYFIGINYMQLKDFNSALEPLKKCVELRPNHGYALFNLGVTYLNLHDNLSAREVHKKLTTINPSLAQKLRKFIR